MEDLYSVQCSCHLQQPQCTCGCWQHSHCTMTPPCGQPLPHSPKWQLLLSCQPPMECRVVLQRMYSHFSTLAKKCTRLFKPQCSTMKGFAFTRTPSSETVSLLSYKFVGLACPYLRWIAEVLKFIAHFSLYIAPLRQQAQCSTIRLALLSQEHLVQRQTVYLATSLWDQRCQVVLQRC